MPLACSSVSRRRLPLLVLPLQCRHGNCDTPRVLYLRRLRLLAAATPWRLCVVALQHLLQLVSPLQRHASVQHQDDVSSTQQGRTSFLASMRSWRALLSSCCTATCERASDAPADELNPRVWTRTFCRCFLRLWKPVRNSLPRGGAPNKPQSDSPLATPAQRQAPHLRAFSSNTASTDLSRRVRLLTCVAAASLCVREGQCTSQSLLT